MNFEQCIETFEKRRQTVPTCKGRYKKGVHLSPLLNTRPFRHAIPKKGVRFSKGILRLVEKYFRKGGKPTILAIALSRSGTKLQVVLR